MFVYAIKNDDDDDDDDNISKIMSSSVSLIDVTVTSLLFSCYTVFCLDEKCYSQ